MQSVSCHFWRRHSDSLDRTTRVRRAGNLLAHDAQVHVREVTCLALIGLRAGGADARRGEAPVACQVIQGAPLRANRGSARTARSGYASAAVLLRVGVGPATVGARRAPSLECVGEADQYTDDERDVEHHAQGVKGIHAVSIDRRRLPVSGCLQALETVPGATLCTRQAAADADAEEPACGGLGGVGKA
jgi:hypothetical protein